MKIVGVGDNVVDYYQDRGEIYPGGNALNIAVLCKRYGVEQSSYIGVIGNDIAAEHIVNSLKAEGVDISRIRKAYGPNGESVISLNENNDRTFVGSNNGGVQGLIKLNFDENDFNYISTHDLMHTSLYSHIEQDLYKLSKKISISFDFSSRHEETYLKEVCPYLDYGFFSGSELNDSQCIELMHYAKNLGTKIIGVTRGEKGALFLVDDQVYKQPIVEAKVIDTLGAGDSFISMFLVHYHQHHNVTEALNKSAIAAAKNCESYGAFGYGLSKKTNLSKDLV
ncbi:PfkB family carbohydrate kinase [Peribacillus frigoritolerans]|uniref:PfkB family carbohydrate kinase n=1 Tax=Peribacillus frigoritolerans TaxID=450367 RepID=UPI0039A05491